MIDLLIYQRFLSYIIFHISHIRLALALLNVLFFLLQTFTEFAKDSFFFTIQFLLAFLTFISSPCLVYSAVVPVDVTLGILQCAPSMPLQRRLSWEIDNQNRIGVQTNSIKIILYSLHCTHFCCPFKREPYSAELTPSVQGGNTGYVNFTMALTG